MRVALVCPDLMHAWHFQKNLLLALRSRGAEVYVIAPVGPEVADLRQAGIHHLPMTLSRWISPRADLRTIAHLYRLCRRYRFDIVHTFTLKLDVYGAIAARLAGVRTILGTVEGLGFTYADPTSFRSVVMQRVMDQLLRVGFALSTRVWLVNDDDLRFLVDRHVLARRKAVSIRSIGVDLRDFSLDTVDSGALDGLRDELGLIGDVPVVTMVSARAVWSKGVREFVEASRLLRGSFPDARFVLLAPIEDGSPQSVPAEYLTREAGDNDRFRWLSAFRTDIRELLALSDVVSLPSYYREGVPRTLLEAMAMGKPLVTTDHVGCRETVDDGRNGRLVPVKDAIALADAFGDLLANPQLRQRFGAWSRHKAEREFSATAVAARVLDELYGLEEPMTSPRESGRHTRRAG